MCIIVEFEIDIKEILPLFSRNRQRLYFSQIQIIKGKNGKNLRQTPFFVGDCKTNGRFIDIISTTSIRSSTIRKRVKFCLWVSILSCNTSSPNNSAAKTEAIAPVCIRPSRAISAALLAVSSDSIRRICGNCLKNSRVWAMAI